MVENKKKTQKEMYMHIAQSMANDTEVVEFCNLKIEQLENKASKSSQTKVQKENEDIKIKILNVLEVLGDYATISEIQKSNEDLQGLSNQKMSALLKQLVDKKQINKKLDKKKAYFKLV